MKKTVSVDIAGSRYSMTADADEEHLARLSDLVNSRLDELGPRALKQASHAQLLAMVALGLADDLLTAHGRVDRLEKQTRGLLLHAIARIDERLEQTGLSSGTIDAPDSESERAGGPSSHHPGTGGGGGVGAGAGATGTGDCQTLPDASASLEVRPTAAAGRGDVPATERSSWASASLAGRASAACPPDAGFASDAVTASGAVQAELPGISEGKSSSQWCTGDPDLDGTA